MKLADKYGQLVISVDIHNVLILSKTVSLFIIINKVGVCHPYFNAEEMLTPTQRKQQSKTTIIDTNVPDTLL